MTLLRTLLALGTGALLAATPATGGLATPAGETSLGIFQAEHGEQDYEATLCGPDLKQLCVRLVALRKGSDTPKGRKFLNVPIIDHINPTGANAWKGTITIQGHTGEGTVKIEPGQNFMMHVCTLIVVCADVNLPRKP